MGKKETGVRRQEAWSIGHKVEFRISDLGESLEDGGQTAEDRSFKLLNIEQQNKKPQNDEVITSIFEIPCSTFCGSNRR